MKGLTILAILVSLLLVVNVCVLWNKTLQPAPKAEVINVPVENSYNDTIIKSDIASIKASLNEDEDWENAAIGLAKVEMEEKNNRNVYDALVSLGYSIVDKEDISSVVVRDTEVTSSDVDEKDATVVQELKVYFEDADGNDVKVYLDLTTEVVDGEVDNTIYEVSTL